MTSLDAGQLRPNRSVDDNDVTILLSSAGRRGALVEALREGAALANVSLRLVATDCSVLSAAAQLCDTFYQVPRISDPAFLNAMLQIVDVEGPLLIVPTIDTELAILAENRKRFVDAGADVLVSSTDTVEICSDKSKSSEWLRTNGFPVPKQYRWDELIDLPAEAWPLFFKPKNGSSSVGAQLVHSPSQVAVAIEQYGRGVIEEFVDGDEYTVDCWVDAAGSCTAEVPRLRLATRAGEVSKGTTVGYAELQEITAAIAESLPNAFGPLTMQAIDGPQGLRVIEVNPRFGGGYPLTHEAGCKLTAAVVAEAAGIPSAPEWFDWHPGVTMLRYDDAVFLAPSASGGTVE
ncbi:MAG: ATP-grasp domain-containing protein [Actinomycetota bacterium]